MWWKRRRGCVFIKEVAGFRREKKNLAIRSDGGEKGDGARLPLRGAGGKKGKSQIALRGQGKESIELMFIKESPFRFQRFRGADKSPRQGEKVRLVWSKAEEGCLVKH